MKGDLFAPGHRACAGCGPAIAMRHILRAAGKDVIIAQATGCMEVTTTPYPETAWGVPWIHVTFENAAAVASGISAALKMQGKEKTKVIAIGGDGASADIGFGAISGMLERGNDVLYIAYDNEAYANTGVQRSGATPMYASTTTTPAGTKIPGKEQRKKDLAMIAAAHHIPYVATANVAFIEDFEKKIKKALEIEGAKFIHVLTPCVPGWGIDSSKTIEYSRLAVETGMWVLYEIENGKIKINYKPSKLKPVGDYLKGQARFKHLTPDLITDIQKKTEKHYNKLIAIDGLQIF